MKKYNENWKESSREIRRNDELYRKNGEKRKGFQQKKELKEIKEELEAIKVEIFNLSISIARLEQARRDEEKRLTEAIHSVLSSNKERERTSWV